MRQTKLSLLKLADADVAADAAAAKAAKADAMEVRTRSRILVRSRQPVCDAVQALRRSATDHPRYMYSLPQVDVAGDTAENAGDQPSGASLLTSASRI